VRAVSEQPERLALADDVVTDLRKTLVGRGRGAVAVDSLISYGAADIDPKHLVVWVLLVGPPASELPAWFAPADGESSADPQQSGVDPDLLVWMRELREEVRAAFDRCGWTSASRIPVLFDSADRVREEGFDYFRA